MAPTSWHIRREHALKTVLLSFQVPLWIMNRVWILWFWNSNFRMYTQDLGKFWTLSWQNEVQCVSIVSKSWAFLGHWLFLWQQNVRINFGRSHFLKQVNQIFGFVYSLCHLDWETSASIFFCCGPPWWSFTRTLIPILTTPFTPKPFPDPAFHPDLTSSKPGVSRM